MFGVLATAIAVASFHLWSYGDALGAFFYFDDFWELTKTQSIAVTSPAEFLQLFEPFPSFLLYRPVSTLVFYHFLRVAFGYDPFAYHATLMAFHVFNALLVYLIARKLFRSSGSGFFAALIYAMAPGHSIAVYWMALFTMTGTAFFYFSALAVWVCAEGRWRIPVTWVLFVVGMLSSEHAVSLPVALTAAAMLLDGERDWRRMIREQAPFYLVSISYALVKLYYIRHYLPIQPSNDYELAFHPANIVEQLGLYLGYGMSVAYDPQRSVWFAMVLGCIVLLAAIGGTVRVLLHPSTPRAVRVGTFGIDIFLLALGPVIFLPNHQQTYYIGIAGLGLSLAVVALTKLVRMGSGTHFATVAFTGWLLATHLFSTNALVFQEVPFRFFNGGSEAAAAWLYTVWFHAEGGRVSEVVVPKNPSTDQVFGKADGEHEAYKFLICPWYEVRQSEAIEKEIPQPGRVILTQPWDLPQERSAARSWAWMRIACPDCNACGNRGHSCPAPCFRDAFRKRHRPQ